jgi:hypothetical protein
MPAYRDPDTGQFLSSKDIVERESPPPLPAGPPPLPDQEDRDAEFLQQAREQEQPAVEPAEGAKDIAESAASGAGTGAAIGSVIPGVGTAVGAGVGFLLGAASGTQRNKPIGSLEGTSGQGTGGEDAAKTMRALLAVQQKIARLGTPVKDAVITQGAGSRL